jgi:hypothetical protein
LEDLPAISPDSSKDPQEIHQLLRPEIEIPDILARALEEHSNGNSMPINPDKLRKASNHLRTLEHGHHAGIPLHCGGKNCPMSKNCILLDAGFTYMIGEQCPIEKSLIGTYSQKIAESLQVNQTNIVEMNMVNEIAKIWIFKLRIEDRLTYEDFIKQQIVAVDDDGVPQYRDELHPSIQWDDMLSRRELKLLEALLATRKSVAEVGGGTPTDPSTNASNIMALLAKAKKKLITDAEIIRAEAAKPTN